MCECYSLHRRKGRNRDRNRGKYRTDISIISRVIQELENLKASAYQAK
jgi:hypothetical protein